MSATFVMATRRPRAARRAGFAVAVLLAVGCGMSAAWIEAKAALAQVLLERAWSATASRRDQIKPWPWADTWPVARLAVPRLDRSWIVLAGASGRTLAFGPGHVDGTALPGETGHAVVAGHRDTQFSALRDVHPGDVLVAERPDGGSARYRVRATSVRDAADLAHLAPRSDTTLTLITCWPFDAVVPGGSLRWVVQADLESEAGPAAAGLALGGPR